MVILSHAWQTHYAEKSCDAGLMRVSTQCTFCCLRYSSALGLEATTSLSLSGQSEPRGRGLRAAGQAGIEQSSKSGFAFWHEDSLPTELMLA